MSQRSKKNKRNEEASSGGSDLIFCSLSLILVALFALLVSYSTLEGEKVTNFKRGFGGSSKKYNRGLQSDSLIENPVFTGGNSPLPSRSGITQVDRASISSDIQSLKKYYKKMGLDKSVHIKESYKGFEVNFGSDVLFPSGQATLTRQVYAYLDHIVSIALKNPCFFIRIEGHTDDIPIHTPEFPSNWELSTARAVNVLRYFLKKKVPAKRLAAFGFSQYRPVESNATSKGRKKNRRVEICFELHKTKKID